MYWRDTETFELDQAAVLEAAPEMRYRNRDLAEQSHGRFGFS